MAETSKAFDPDTLALSVEVGERFDAVAWKAFNDASPNVRNKTRTEVLDIRKDLLQVAAVDPQLAAKVWDDHVPSYVPRPAELPKADIEPEPVNTIEPGRRRRRAQAEPYLDPSIPTGSSAPDHEVRSEPAGKSADPAKADTAVSVPQGKETLKEVEDPKAERLRMLLEGLEKQYLKADNKYHFRDRGREVAFEAQEKKLMTAHDTPAVVGSMIDLAEARGWSSLKLSGTDEFKREAWLQASLRDFEVSGYRPNAVDKARLEELKAERGASQSGPAQNVVADVSKDAVESAKAKGFRHVSEAGAHEPPLALTKPQDQAVGAMEVMMRSRGDSPRAISMARAELTERLRSDRVYVGKLVEVGTAPYQDKPNEKPSHFVTLENEQGRRTKVWGVDLPRALKASGAAPGEKVALAFKGRRTVTVDEPVRNESGKVVSHEKKDVDRNTWEMVGFDRLRDSAKVRVQAGADRAEKPAELRVFDRHAPSRAPQQEVKVERTKTRERQR